MLEERASMPVKYLQMVSVPVSSQDRARYVSFQDPDGNTWMIQELRAGGTD
jgi:hypothetical protein